MPFTIGKLLADAAIRVSQHIPAFSARGSYSGARRDPRAAFDDLAKAEVEFADDASFHENLGIDFRIAIEGKTVLDYGSGFGGRTVWLSQWAKWAEGVEINQPQVDASAEFAAMKNATNVHFSLGREDKILFADDFFDVIVSFDVIEHVRHPDVMLAEMYRVLRPDGIAILIFTPYYGMFSHHLGYITYFPGLHWFFAPETLIATVNELLQREPKFQNLGISQQPAPALSYNGRRKCLPKLNGITKAEYRTLVHKVGFLVEWIRSTPILEKFPLLGACGLTINRMLQLLPMGDELFSHNLASILRKPAA